MEPKPESLTCLRITLTSLVLCIVGFVGFVMCLQLVYKLSDYEIVLTPIIVIGFIYLYGLFMFLIGCAMLYPTRTIKWERKHLELFYWVYILTAYWWMLHSAWLEYAVANGWDRYEPSEIRVITDLRVAGQVIFVLGGAMAIMLFHLGSIVLLTAVVLGWFW